MDILAKNLRARAESLGLSHAEVARRIGLSERRYAHYVAGRNEPDLMTLMQIARSLDTPPNDLLGFGPEAQSSARSLLHNRLTIAVNRMDDRAFEITVVQAEAVAAL